MYTEIINYSMLVCICFSHCSINNDKVAIRVLVLYLSLGSYNYRILLAVMKVASQVSPNIAGN